MMSKKILLYIPGSYIAGAEKTNIETVRLLKRFNYQIHCLISGWNDGAFKKILVEENVSFTELKVGAFYVRKIGWTIDSALNFLPAFYRFFRTYNRLKPDVVYFISPWQFYLFARFLKSSAIIFREHNYPNSSTRTRLLYKCIQKYSTKIIVASEYVYSRVIDFGVQSGKIVVIPELVKETTSYQPTFKSSGLLNIAIVGQVIFRKGHDILLKSLAGLDKTLQNTVRLYIIGPINTEFKILLDKIILERDIACNIIYTGNYEGSTSLYKNYELDLVIVPSRTEAFGRVALEPAFNAIPVIASNTGGLNEIVKHGETGFLFEPENSGELKAMIEQYLKDPGLLKAHGLKAKENALEHFSYDALSKKTLMVFS